MIDVSSHAVNSAIRSSATTMPSIAPANSVEQTGEAVGAVAVAGRAVVRTVLRGGPARSTTTSSRGRRGRSPTRSAPSRRRRRRAGRQISIPSCGTHSSDVDDGVAVEHSVELGRQPHQRRQRERLRRGRRHGVRAARRRRPGRGRGRRRTGPGRSARRPAGRWAATGRHPPPRLHGPSATRPLVRSDRECYALTGWPEHSDGATTQLDHVSATGRDEGQLLHGPGHRHVEQPGAAGRAVEDLVGLDDDDAVELKPLTCSGPNSGTSSWPSWWTWSTATSPALGQRRRDGGVAVRRGDDAGQAVPVLDVGDDCRDGGGERGRRPSSIQRGGDRPCARCGSAWRRRR